MKVNDRYCSFYYLDDNDYEPIRIDPAKTALLIVDMQHVFVTRPDKVPQTEEEIHRAEAWEQFYRAIDETVIPNNRRLLLACRKIGMEVMFAKIQCRKQGGAERSLDHKASGYNELLLLPGDPLAEIVPELAPVENEIVFMKTTDSAVTGTNLRLTLSNMGIDTVIVTGVLTDQCVSGTVRSLADESFKVWLIEDATRAATQEIQDAELAILNNIYCHVISTDECIQAIMEGTEANNTD